MRATTAFTKEEKAIILSGENCHSRYQGLPFPRPVSAVKPSLPIVTSYKWNGRSQRLREIMLGALTRMIEHLPASISRQRSRVVVDDQTFALVEQAELK